MSEQPDLPAGHSQPRPGGIYRLAGHEVGRIGYGVMQLPRLKDATAARKVLRRAHELGVNHFDTAHYYGAGAANQYLADELGLEDDVVIVTKVGVRPATSDAMPLVAAQRPGELREAVLDNLRTPKTDHLAVVNLRRIAPGTFPLPEEQVVDMDDQIAEMVAMRDEGLIGAIGLSAVSLAELRAALPAGIVCVQNQYGLTARTQEPVLDLCRAEGIAWAPFFPLGGAFSRTAKADDRRVVQRIVSTMAVTPAQIAQAWLLRHAENTLLIPGTTSIAHLEENVAAGALRLDDQAMAELDATTPAESSAAEPGSRAPGA